MEDKKNDMVEKKNLEEDKGNIVEEGNIEEDKKNKENEKQIEDSIKTRIGMVMALFLLGFILVNLNKSENLTRLSFSFNQPQGANPKNELQVTVNQISGVKTTELSISPFSISRCILSA